MDNMEAWRLQHEINDLQAAQNSLLHELSWKRDGVESWKSSMALGQHNRNKHHSYFDAGSIMSRQQKSEAAVRQLQETFEANQARLKQLNKELREALGLPQEDESPATG